MKSFELKQVSRGKVGRVVRNGVKTTPGEDSAVLYLTQFGFDIELIKPTSTKKAHNPDIMMLGMFWEVKRPSSANETTIKNRFRKAAKQARNIIFDLRAIKIGADGVEKQILKMLEENGNVRRLMIIRKNGEIIDIIK